MVVDVVKVAFVERETRAHEERARARISRRKGEKVVVGMCR